MAILRTLQPLTLHLLLHIAVSTSKHFEFGAWYVELISQYRNEYD